MGLEEDGKMGPMRRVGPERKVGPVRESVGP